MMMRASGTPPKNHTATTPPGCWRSWRRKELFLIMFSLHFWFFPASCQNKRGKMAQHK
jgi:hypothetical protein